MIPAMDWTGISVGSRAGVDLLAKRKIPAPPLKDWFSVSNYSLN